MNESTFPQGQPGGGRRVGGGRGGANRRAVLKGAGLTAFGIGSVAILPLFGTPSAEQDPADCKATDASSSSKQVVVSNWPDYIDPINHKASTVKEFESATGITVHYTDDVSDNAEFFAKVRNQLGACQTIGRTGWRPG